MKSVKMLVGAMCALMLTTVSCGETEEPIVTPDIPVVASYPEPDAPENGDYLIVVKFAGDVCNDIVFAGSYNSWSTDPAAMLKFAPYTEGETTYEGWYYVQFADTAATVQGKPVQLKSDGTFTWDFQTGDAASWTIDAGDVTVADGYAGEADLTYNGKVAVMESAYWKNQGSPCVEVVANDYTIIVTSPDTTVPQLAGDFNGWTFQDMTATANANEYSYTLNDTEGHAFKVLSNSSWDNEAVYAADYNAETNCYTSASNTTLGTETTVSLTVAGWKGAEGIAICE